MAAAAGDAAGKSDGKKIARARSAWMLFLADNREKVSMGLALTPAVNGVEIGPRIGIGFGIGHVFIIGLGIGLGIGHVIGIEAGIRHGIGVGIGLVIQIGAGLGHRIRTGVGVG